MFVQKPFSMQENVPLADMTTMRAGGAARFLCEVMSENDLCAATVFSQERGVPLVILGGGSNVVIADCGVAGVVAHMAMKGLTATPDPHHVGNTLLHVAAGEAWDDVVAYAVSHDWCGIENLSAIPGTVGGAVYQNIGAYGAEIKDVVVSVTIFDRERMATQIIPASACAFGYRTSIFQHPPGNRYVILSATLCLRRDGVVNTSYPDVHAWLARMGVAHPTVRDIRAAVCAIRAAKLPDPAIIGTAGSFFKNPLISKALYDELAERYPKLPGYPNAEGTAIKVSLAWILDKVLSVNGMREGAVGLYATQPLALVNHGGATCDEIMTFAQKISHEVMRATGIAIEREVHLLA